MRFAPLLSAYHARLTMDRSNTISSAFDGLKYSVSCGVLFHDHAPLGSYSLDGTELFTRISRSNQRLSPPEFPQCLTVGGYGALSF